MLETTVAAIHPRWPEAQSEGGGWGGLGGGVKTAGLALCWFSFLFSVREKKKKKKKGCPGVYCISISSGINDKEYNTFHSVIHLGNVPGPKPISKSLLFPGPPLLFILSTTYFSLQSLLYFNPPE